jgi:cell division protein FtsA
MTKDAKNLIVGLDIGTSKMVAVVAEVMGERPARSDRTRPA